MDVAAFHAKLLGIDQDRTPEAFRLSPDALSLYQSDKRGFRGPLYDLTTVATIVLALSLTHSEDGPQAVVMAVPMPAADHTMHWLNLTARHIFRQRRGEVESVKVLRAAWKQLVKPRLPIGMVEPPRWVAFGYDAEIPAPAWVEGRLVGDD